MMVAGQGKVRVTTHLPSITFLLSAGAVCTFVGASPALADPLAEPTPIERSAGTPPAAESAQKYDGVVPGPTGRNPLPAAPAGGPYLVWTGFQMTAAGSQVFLQTTRPVEYDEKAGARTKSGKSALSIVLRGCRIHMANNRRKIDTRFFATPVSSISAKQKGHDIEIRIALREGAEATPHTQAGPDGTQFLVLDFPPGKAAPEPSALQDMAAADSPDGQARGDEQELPKAGRARKAAAKAADKSSE